MALYRLFQPKSIFPFYGIRLLTERTRCIFCSNVEILENESVEEEKSISAIEPSVKQNKPEEVSVLRDDSKKAISLRYLFMKHNYKRIEAIAENEATKHKESLSDTLYNLPKDGNLPSSSNDLLPSVATDELNDDHLVNLLQNEFEDDPQRCEKLSREGDVITSPSDRTLLLNELGRISKKGENLSNEAGGISSSIRIRKILDLEDLVMKQTHEKEAEEIAKSRSLFTHYQSFEDSNKPCSRIDEDKGAGIKGVIDFMKLQNNQASNTNEDYDDSGPVQENLANSNVERFDNNDRFSMDSSDGNEETNILDSENIDNREYKESTYFSVPKQSKHQMQLNDTLKSGKMSEKNKVLVRFLRKHITERNLYDRFSCCGEILKIEILDSKAPLYKVAHIYFKTTEGFEKALQRNGMTLANGVIIVESATSMEKIAPKIPFLSLIGDPNIPAALVKNPTRTIKIKNLTHEISSHHIEEALAFCETHISGYFLGSSISIAYVEFGTEIGKKGLLQNIVLMYWERIWKC